MGQIDTHPQAKTLIPEHDMVETPNEVESPNEVKTPNGVESLTPTRTLKFANPHTNFPPCKCANFEADTTLILGPTAATPQVALTTSCPELEKLDK